MKRAFLFIMLLVVLIALDYLGLRYAADFFWSFLWPQPAIFAVVGLVMVFAIWPGMFRSKWTIGAMAVLALFVSQVAAMQVFGIAEQNAGLLVVGSLLIVLISLQGYAIYGALSNTVPTGEYLPYLPVVALLVLSNFMLLIYFNTLLWPYLWPKPAIFAIVAAAFALLVFPELSRGIWLLRIVGLLQIFVGECYLFHSFGVLENHFSALALIHFIGFAGMYVVILINYGNQIRPRSNTAAPLLPADLPYVVAVIPTYNEPYKIVERTLQTLLALDYPRDRLSILISDDGHRSEMREIARTYRVAYNYGAQRDAKAGNLNSALRYIKAHWPQAQLVLTQDADELVLPEFLCKTVGYFSDPQVAFVQTPKDVIAPPNDPFGTRDRVFYDILQVGRNGTESAFACGSGVIWRIDAVESIGGFSTWNLVEDLTTSYNLHSAGYRSEYHNEVLSVGLAPDDIPGLLKQRGTWAVDNWRLFMFDNPLFKKGLSRGQRSQYLELGLFYATSTFFTPLLMLVPVIALATGQFIPIEGSALFPWILTTLVYYIVLTRGKGFDLLRMWQYWIGLWPTYTMAFFIALRSRNKKPRYVVTRKTRLSGFYGYLLWPQFLYLIGGAVLVVHALVGMPWANAGARLTNAGILLFFMFMVSTICRAAFYGVTLQQEDAYVPAFSNSTLVHEERSPQAGR